MAVRLISNVVGLARLAAGVPRFLRTALPPEQAAALVRRGLEQRERRFLTQLEKAVWPRPKSPYRRLLAAAGCEREDIERLLASDGLDATLTKLRDAGVYVSWEELKAREPIRRGSTSFTVRETDFDNPAAKLYFESSSSGASGRAARMRVDLAHIDECARDWGVWFESQGWLRRPLVFWTPDHGCAT